MTLAVEDNQKASLSKNIECVWYKKVLFKVDHDVFLLKVWIYRFLKSPRKINFINLKTITYPNTWLFNHCVYVLFNKNTMKMERVETNKLKDESCILMGPQREFLSVSYKYQCIYKGMSMG